MNEIIAIVRPNKVTKTVKALEAVGFPALTVIKCFGRGKQRGYLDANLPDVVDIKKVVEEREKQGLYMKYIPKRLISIVVNDQDVPLVVGIIMKVNRTRMIGDGRIFVLPVENAIRVRTGEVGEEALCDLMLFILLNCDECIPERIKHIYAYDPEEEIVPLCNSNTVPGDLTERGCAFAGARGVVGGPIKDVIHMIYGPIGCAVYTWGTRRNLSDNDLHRRYCFSTDMQETDIVYGGE